MASCKTSHLLYRMLKRRLSKEINPTASSYTCDYEIEDSRDPPKPAAQNQNVPCFCITDKNLTMTFEEGRMIT